MTIPIFSRDYKDWEIAAPYVKGRRVNRMSFMPAESTPPEACASMRELRAAIDGLDAKLVAMLALRQRYIERAAVLKQTRDAVRDGARIEAVVCHVTKEAKQVGLSPVIAERVWRALIEASIAHEYEAFDAKSVIES